MNTVVMISANAEWEGTKPLFPDAYFRNTPFGESADVSLDNWNLTLMHSGWGKIASAATMQYVVDNFTPDLIVNLGTCGGFEGVSKRGDLILVERTIVYDILELMDEADISPYYASTLDLSWLTQPQHFLARRGLMASADSDLLPEKIPTLRSKGAIAADWESAALAWVATKNDTRLLILRMVSDLVSETEGEAYGDIGLFKERSREIMKQLFEQLPGWLDSVEIK